MLTGLKTYLRVAWACKTPLVFLLDKEYRQISSTTLLEIAQHIKERFEYIAEISDCDDAALLLREECMPGMWPFALKGCAK
ncbi:MAG: hypothetical protein ACXABY_36710 [Candidatus Thorarchaeota archaeon]|jgi:hypothetical protein